jgi:hypothetical protein
MSGTTTELALATAVDTDDNADYLTLSLANSLRTVDALFNNLTGHTHVGAHQGAPIVPAAGSITGAMIADGSVGTADLANGSVTNAKLASDTARLNLLVNGGLEIWQRGPGPMTSSFCADRWEIALGGTSTLSVARSGVNDGFGSSASAQCTYTHAAGGSAELRQKLEDYLQPRGRTFSVSMRVRSNVACNVFIRDSVGSASSTVHTGNDTWQTLTATRTIDSAAVSLYVGVSMATGSGTVYIDNAMLVMGSQAADYAPMHPADDLARCQRYYEILGGKLVVGGYNLAGSTIYAPLQFRATKPVVPTVTKNGTWSLLNTAVGAPLVTSGTDIYGCTLNVVATATNPALAATVDATTFVSIEANP